jgi:murein L,D-transpeptidase YcbB/YkuD
MVLQQACAQDRRGQLKVMNPFDVFLHDLPDKQFFDGLHISFDPMERR